MGRNEGINKKIRHKIAHLTNHSKISENNNSIKTPSRIKIITRDRDYK